MNFEDFHLDHITVHLRDSETEEYEPKHEDVEGIYLVIFIAVPCIFDIYIVHIPTHALFTRF